MKRLTLLFLLFPLSALAQDWGDSIRIPCRQPDMDSTELIITGDTCWWNINERWYFYVETNTTGDSLKQYRVEEFEQINLFYVEPPVTLRPIDRKVYYGRIFFVPCVPPDEQKEEK